MNNSIPKIYYEYFGSIVMVMFSWITADILYRFTLNNRLSMVFMCGVLLSAYKYGSGPAYLSGILSFLIYNFYLTEPRFTLEFGPEDLLTLTTFLVTAMLTGRLTGQIRDAAARAESRSRALGMLYEASRAFSSESDEEEIRTELCRRLSIVTKAPAHLRDGLKFISNPPEAYLSADDLRLAMRVEREARQGQLTTANSNLNTMRPLMADEACLGVAIWSSRSNPDTHLDDQISEILVDLGASAIARVRLGAAKADAEARSKTEELRNTLLASVSHDLRTPLAAILASASSLAEYGEKFTSETRRDLALNIQQEAERLDGFIARILNLSRILSGQIQIEKNPFLSASALRNLIIDNFQDSIDRIEFDISDDSFVTTGDQILFRQAFLNIVENSIKYSPPNSLIYITHRAENGRVVIEIEDDGPGLPSDQWDLIFQKFFRSSHLTKHSGTGLGLAIAKGFIEKMGGSISASVKSKGLVVRTELPGMEP